MTSMRMRAHSLCWRSPPAEDLRQSDEAEERAGDDADQAQDARLDIQVGDLGDAEKDEKGDEGQAERDAPRTIQRMPMTLT